MGVVVVQHKPTKTVVKVCENQASYEQWLEYTEFSEGLLTTKYARVREEQ